jgi:Amt family ammonium transporter
MVAGLATITPASGFVSVGGAMLIGLGGGVGCYFAVTRLKAKLGYDDSLDAFGVHGVGSTIGMLMLGLLASAQANPAIADTFQRGGHAVSLVGSSAQLLNQGIGVLVTALFSALATFVILKLVSAITGGLRVNDEQEEQGLDIALHGEEAYNG